MRFTRLVPGGQPLGKGAAVKSEQPEEATAASVGRTVSGSKTDWRAASHSHGWPRSLTVCPKKRILHKYASAVTDADSGNAEDTASSQNQSEFKLYDST